MSEPTNNVARAMGALTDAQKENLLGDGYPPATQGVGEPVAWQLDAAAKAKATPYVDDGEDYPLVARARLITDAVLTAASYRDAYLAVEGLIERSALPSPQPDGRDAGLEEAGGIRICPERDGRCPHGMSCPYTDGRYHCDIEASHRALKSKPSETSRD